MGVVWSGDRQLDPAHDERNRKATRGREADYLGGLKSRAPRPLARAGSLRWLADAAGRKVATDSWGVYSNRKGGVIPMRERHRYSHEIPEANVNRFPAAESSDDDEEDDQEEEEERRHNEGEEEEEEEPVWTASGR